MKRRHFLAMTAMGALAACGSFKIDYPTTPEGAKDWKVVSVDVDVPQTLTASSENVFNPPADIVWWEDYRPYGHDRAKEILTDGVRSAAAATSGKRRVRLAVTAIRFHGMTPHATTRLTISGAHTVQFYAQVFDASTGAALTSAEKIYAEIPALHGEEYNIANSRGQTSRVRVTKAIAKSVAGWLGAGPDVRQSFTRIGS